MRGGGFSSILASGSGGQHPSGGLIPGLEWEKQEQQVGTEDTQPWPEPRAPHPIPSALKTLVCELQAVTHQGPGII